MIGLIAAMQIELEMLLEKTDVKEKKTVSGMTFTVGTLAEKTVVMTVCGEGKVNAALAAQTMILLYAPSLIINTGVAGSLSPDLGVGDTAVASAVCQHDYDLSPLGYPKGRVLFPGGSADRFPTDKAVSEAILDAAAALGVHTRLGVIATGDVFVADDGLKASLVQAFDAIACEMEGGAIGHACTLAGVPFAAIRAISDNADDAKAFDPVSASAVSVAITERVLVKM